MKVIERDTGMKILVQNHNFSRVKNAAQIHISDKPGNMTYNIPALPGKKYQATMKAWLKPDEVSIRDAYHTDAKCAAYTSAWPTVINKLKDGIGFPLEDIPSNISSIPDDELFSAVTDAIRHPPCIRKAALKFVEEVFGGQAYAAVHWRYDQRDWLGRCDRGKAKGTQLQFCEEIRKILPSDIATAIVNALLGQIPNKNASISSMHFYIAHPPALNEFVNEVYQISKNLSTLIQLPSISLKNYLEKNVEKCWKKNRWKNSDDILSLVEMEIMLLSDWFFYAKHSSWSNNVRDLHWTNVNDVRKKKYEASIFELAIKEANKRLSSAPT